MIHALSSRWQECELAQFPSGFFRDLRAFVDNSVATVDAFFAFVGTRMDDGDPLERAKQVLDALVLRGGTRSVSGKLRQVFDAHFLGPHLTSQVVEPWP